jgi:hypothetical protein
MDFINPESAEKYVEKVGMKKNVLLLSLFQQRRKIVRSVSTFISKASITSK